MALNTTNPSQRQGSNYVCKAHGKIECPAHFVVRICCTPRLDPWKGQTPNTTPKGTNTTEIAE